MMRVVRPTVPSNLLVETGLMGRCEGGVHEMTHRCETI